MRESEEIRILIVEDVEEKARKIEESLRESGFHSENVTLSLARADSFSSAQSVLEKQFFDIVILDLKIPVFRGGEPSLENSKLLYEFIRDVAPSKPFFVLGLTSVPQQEVEASFQETPNFSICRFESSNKWLEHLVDRIGFVIGAKSGLSDYLNNNYGVDAIIVTARKRNEFDPILSTIEWVNDFNAPKAVLGEVHNRFGYVELAPGVEISLGIVCLDEMGLSHSAAVTANLVSTFRPKHLAMLGMCCGLKKIVQPGAPEKGGTCKLGDIVVARDTCCWDEGKYEDDDPNLVNSAFFNNRAVNKSPKAEYWRNVDRFLDANDTELAKIVKQLYEQEDLQSVRQRLIGGVQFDPSASIHWGTIVSGPCVIDSEEMITTIEQRFPRAIGLEMEAHSIYSAVDCSIGVKPHVLVIKGVADFGDGTKAKPVQAMASAGSYLVYREILKNQMST